MGTCEICVVELAVNRREGLQERVETSILGVNVVSSSTIYGMANVNCVFPHEVDVCLADFYDVQPYTRDPICRAIFPFPLSINKRLYVYIRGSES